MSEEVRQATPPDEEMSEYWERSPDGETYFRGVEVYTGEFLEGYWKVVIPAQEYFREDTLGLELRRRLQVSLSAVPGVAEVEEQDNETWLVTGSPSGEGLCRAAANVLDELADRMRNAFQGLDGEY
jgi:hypothetical protein